jgi:hypothetical protein
MKHSRKTLVLAFVAALMTGMPCMAQDVEPPFTWEGKGVASFISEGGIREADFQFELSIDEQGMVDGKTSNEDGTSKIRHVFYTEPKQYDFPGFFTRNIVIVLIFDEYGNNPMLSVVNGRTDGVLCAQRKKILRRLKWTTLGGRNETRCIPVRQISQGR